jgi:hypothetical protein
MNVTQLDRAMAETRSWGQGTNWAGTWSLLHLVGLFDQAFAVHATSDLFTTRA